MTKENLRPILIYSCALQFLFLKSFSTSTHLLEAITKSYSNFYCVVGIFLLLFMNTFHTYQAFESNRILVLRLKGKKQLLRQLIIQVVCSNFLVLLLNILLQFTIFQLFGGYSFQNPTYLIYSIDYLTYTIFFLIRSCLILEAISVFMLFLFKLFGYIGTFIPFLIYFCSLNFTAWCPDCMIEKISQIKINPIQYFLQNPYVTFSFEIGMSILYLFGFVIILYMIYQLTYRLMKRVGDENGGIL